MHRGTERASYIPFLLNPETRSDVIPVRLHFRETIPQARQLINHRRVCVNNEMVKMNHLKLSHGDIISFQENNARIRGEEIRRFFHIEISVQKIIEISMEKRIKKKCRKYPVRMWRRIKRIELPTSRHKIERSKPSSSERKRAWPKHIKIGVVAHRDISIFHKVMNVCFFCCQLNTDRETIFR